MVDILKESNSTGALQQMQTQLNVSGEQIEITEERIVALSKVPAVTESIEKLAELVSDYQAEKVDVAKASPNSSSESGHDSSYTDDDFELDSKVSNNLQ
jgi:hypothetical protein